MIWSNQMYTRILVKILKVIQLHLFSLKPLGPPVIYSEHDTEILPEVAATRAHLSLYGVKNNEL